VVKNLKIAAALLITTTTVSVAAISLSNQISFIAKAEDTTTWGHYSFVSPTLNNVGCREFWISCDNLSITFSEPSSGEIINRGTPNQEDINSWISKNDGRIIPQYRIDDNLFQLGMYPQSRVDDVSLLTTLNTLTNTYENGYYFYEGNYYVKVNATPNDSKSCFDDGSSIETGAIYWFKVEPIKWKVLSSESNDHFLTTEMILDKKEYNDGIAKADRTDYQGNVGTNVYGINYKYSTLRSYLNTSFYNKAFFIDNNNILTTEVDNSVSTTYNASESFICENTFDKVFALSYKECMNEANFPNAASRICKTTEYARAVGAYSGTIQGYINNGWYYTRSPHADKSGVASYVYHAGNIYDGLNFTYTNAGIRPGLHLSSN